MTEQPHNSEIRRILVALDSSGRDQEALQIAARLAALLQAELLGLFIQDPDLMRFADLPIASEVISYSASARSVDRAKLEKDLQAQVKRMSSELARLALQQKVRWSFEVVSGFIESEVMEAVKQADLLIVHRKSGRTLVTHDQLGSTASVIVTKAQRPVVILEEHGTLEGPLYVLIEELESGKSALAAALRLSRRNHRKLIVLIATASLKQYQQLSKSIENWLRAQERRAELSWLRKVEPAVLSHILWVQGGGVLVLCADAHLLRQITLATLIKQLKLPIVLVR